MGIVWVRWGAPEMISIRASGDESDFYGENAGFPLVFRE